MTFFMEPTYFLHVMELTAGVREKNSRLQLFLMSLVTKCTLVSNYVVFNGGAGGDVFPELS